MNQMMLDPSTGNLGEAIRQAIDAALLEGAGDIAEELRMILLMVPVEHGGEYRN